MRGPTALAASLGVMAGISLMAWLATHAPVDLTHAIGVISQCGIYAVATIDSSGAVEIYDAAREATAAVEAAVNALEPAQRTVIQVPCPAPVPFSDGPAA